MILKLLNVVATEDLAKFTSEETEVVIYAKITNPEGLSQANKIEQHEQAQVKTKKGSIRVRKITEQGKDPVFELTAKEKKNDSNVQSSIEITKRITEDIYNMFMTVCENFMSKTRYTFKVENLRVKVKDLEASISAKDMNWEVDVFTNPKGQVSQWCKIDLEVQNLKKLLEENNLEVGDIKLIASIGKLPFAPNNVVIDDKSQDDPDKRALITALYETEFLIPKK